MNNFWWWSDKFDVFFEVWQFRIVINVCSVSALGQGWWILTRTNRLPLLLLLFSGPLHNINRGVLPWFFQSGSLTGRGSVTLNGGKRYGSLLLLLCTLLSTRIFIRLWNRHPAGASSWRLFGVNHWLSYQVFLLLYIHICVALLLEVLKL